MPQTYKFQVSMPVGSLLPRDRFVNNLHFEHSVGALAPTDLENMAGDLAAVYAHHYSQGPNEITVKAYDTDAVPNYPRATVTVGSGFWAHSGPQEVACCLSYHGGYAGNKNERGRIFLAPGLHSVVLGPFSVRPSDTVINWALGFYKEPNQSFPDLGGVDWKFGIWSQRLKTFKQAQVGWVNDEWDTMRSRGLRETKRITDAREG